MKKDIEWLKDEVEDLQIYNNLGDCTDRSDPYIRYAEGVHDTVSRVKELIDQLDEPEVLLWEWIDKKRLINRVENYIPLHDKSVGDVINGILEIIKQLPELEVLSPEWIDKHTYYENEYDFYYADPDELQNLLVPKQELPVIPKYVAEYLDFAKRDASLMQVLELASTIREWDERERWNIWISANVETFARAWLNGYKVAEEQKYYVEDEEHSLLCKWKSSDGWKVISTLEIANDDLPIKILDFKLTEQEIKDYDERYLAFKIPVEEVQNEKNTRRT